MEKQYNMSKLKGRIVEVYDTQRNFAEKIGSAPDKVSIMLSGKREFSQSEIEVWADALMIDPQDYALYFFAH